jgi:hypothetical protein
MSEKATTSNMSFMIDLSTNGVNSRIIAGDGFEKHNNNSGIIHEHDFELLTLGSLPNDVSYLKCKTCNEYFCDSCGRVVINRQDRRPHEFSCKKSKCFGRVRRRCLRA